jgi:Lsr2
MAQRVQTLFIDDIDGGPAEGTVRFGLDGTEFEIDLSARHSEELHNTLQKYVSHARKVGGTTKRVLRGRRSGDTIDTTAVRAWAKEHGVEVKERGRVPADVIAKYRQATGV